MFLTSAGERKNIRLKLSSPFSMPKDWMFLTRFLPFLSIRIISISEVERSPVSRSLTRSMISRPVSASAVLGDQSNSIMLVAMTVSSRGLSFILKGYICVSISKKVQVLSRLDS